MSNLSYQTFVTFPSLSYLAYLLTLCSLYQILSPYQSFVVLSNFCHLLAPCYLFTFYVIISPYKCTYCAHHKHNSFSCLIVCTLSAPIHFPNSTGVFGHRAILTMGGSDRGWGFPHRTNRFVLESSVKWNNKSHHLSKGDTVNLRIALSEEAAGKSLQKCEQINDLGIAVNAAFTPLANVLAAANKARGMLCFTKRSFTCLTKEIFVPLYSAFVLSNMPFKQIVHTSKRG